MTIVNLDPGHMQHGMAEVSLDSLRSLGTGRLDLPGRDEAYIVQDLLDDAQYTWRGERNYVRLEPGARQGHILWLPRVRP